MSDSGLAAACLSELEMAMAQLANSQINEWSIHRYSNVIDSISVDRVTRRLDLAARAIFPTDQKPSVNRVKWREVRRLGVRRGTLYVLKREGCRSMYFAISKTEVRRVIIQGK